MSDNIKNFKNTIFNLNTLNGENGFAVSSTSKGDNFGESVAGGFDFNHDGIDDVIIGAPDSPGMAYIIFGSTNQFSTPLDPQTLNSTTGVVIYGVTAQDHFAKLGSVSSAGDFNGDGIDDVIIGAPNASPNNVNQAGSAYVVFGSTNIKTPMSVSQLNGENGFSITGIKPLDNLGFVGGSRGGDVNGDGLADLIIGAPGANNAAGAIYVIYGSKEPFAASISAQSINGTNGAIFEYMTFQSFAGNPVSLGGDFNADNLTDIMIGIPQINGKNGQAAIVFGSKDFPAVTKLNSLNGANGFTVTSVNNQQQQLGFDFDNAGDVNGDGIDDMIISAPYNGGVAIVIYGSGNAFPSNINYQSASLSVPGFFINPSCETASDIPGYSVSGIGDFNDDGIDDVAFSAPLYGNQAGYPGSVWVIYGNKTRFNSNVDNCNLGSDGIQIPGLSGGNFGGATANAGDVNHDGIADLIGGATPAGQAFVVFGSAFFGESSFSGLGGETNISSDEI